MLSIYITIPMFNTLYIHYELHVYVKYKTINTCPKYLNFFFIFVKANTLSK